MNNALILNAKSFFQKNWIWIVIAAFFVLILTKTIVDKELLYAGIIVFSPLLLYLFIHKPFIFPFGLYVFLLPLESLFVLTGADKGPTLAKLLGALSICAILLKGHFERKLKGPDAINIWWVLFIFYGFSSIAWGISQAGTVRLSTGLGLLILYVVLSSYQIQKKEYEQLKWIIFAAGLLTTCLTIYSYQTILAITGTQYRASIRLGEAATHVNAMAFDLLFPLSICIAMMLNQKKVIMKGLFFLFVIMMLFAIILTGSRAGLSAALTVMLVYLLSMRNLNKKIAFVFVIILTAVIIIPLIPEFMIERITASVESHADGRVDIWIVGLYALKKYWLFGAGLENFPLAYTEFANYHHEERFLGFNRGPHNIYVGFFVELGIVGISLMIIALIKHYKAISRAINNRTEQITLKATFWGIMVTSLSGDIVWSKMFWLLFMMIIMHKNVCVLNMPHRLQ